MLNVSNRGHQKDVSVVGWYSHVTSDVFACATVHLISKWNGMKVRQIHGVRDWLFDKRNTQVVWHQVSRDCLFFCVVFHIEMHHWTMFDSTFTVTFTDVAWWSLSAQMQSLNAVLHSNKECRVKLSFILILFFFSTPTFSVVNTWNVTITAHVQHSCGTC